ncbi:hypothetical protein CLOBOL_00813 [Enterocloster bolteae ATCC BAA-613]|uniref:Uncharacterized protein n=1 Tax=Enterocloster bolteae (strain ATCC BAA-613 / DSM 15670 / CCUG 46953 / JCM 12243 / WAL 16351) TaxID=411902 RepID=A8RIW8_ENTBW|nr:hypothetical protein CLOBOL_00813 [Enterocloster bolteae ATCC BAA-613]
MASRKKYNFRKKMEFDRRIMINISRTNCKIFENIVE